MIVSSSSLSKGGELETGDSVGEGGISNLRSEGIAELVRSEGMAELVRSERMAELVRSGDSAGAGVSMMSSAPKSIPSKSEPSLTTEGDPRSN